jgi:hypothetical protein
MMMQVPPARVLPQQQQLQSPPHQHHATQQFLMQLQQQQPSPVAQLYTRPATFASSSASMQPMFQHHATTTAPPAVAVDNNPYLKYQSLRPSPYRPTTLETVVAQFGEVSPYERSSRKGNTGSSQSEGDTILATSYALIPPTANAVIEYPPLFEPDNRVYREDSPECIKTNDPTKWGYMDTETDPAKPVFRQFNLVPGQKKVAPWFEHISVEYEQKKNKETGQMESTKVYDGSKWICKSPEPIRWPTAFRYTTLRFELTPHYYQSMDAFCDQLKAKGKIELTIPDQAMQQYFAADHNYTKKSIIVDRIWIIEQHSTFKEPLEVQMYSTHYKSGAEERHPPVAWFQLSGPGRGAQSCPHVIYPDTHHLSPPLPVYQIPPTSELDEFNRWINVDERALRRMKEGCTHAGYHYKVRGMASKEIHCENMLQYLVTTEWSPRINAEAAVETSIELQRHHAQIQKGEDGDPAYMVVNKTILDKLVDEKFTGNMDRGMYLMRVDQSITLEIRLKNHTGANTQFLNEVVAMHPGQHVSLSFAVVVCWDDFLGPDY